MTSNLIDRLENRTHFDAGPVVTSSLFVGDHNAISALVIGFDRAMDPATVQDVDNFRVVGNRNGGRSQRLPFAAATYNASTFAVTLTRSDLFSLRFFKRLRVTIDGAKAGDVTDASGSLLDGNRDGEAGKDSVTSFKVHRGRGFNYRDLDGDRVKLKARGAEGRRPLFSLSVKKRTVTQLWLDGFNNTLTGTIRQTRTSNGIVPIGRVVVVHPSNTNALESSFTVGQTVTDGQAPVDPLIRTF